MHIDVQPPSEARSGNVLDPPTRISLRPHGVERGEEVRIADISGYWAFISVVSEDGTTTLAPPSTSLLSGTLVAPVHEACPNGDEQEAGHLSFENLTINQPGNFRLRISLLRMVTVNTGASGAVDGVSLQPSVRNTGSVVTHVVRVGGNIERRDSVRTPDAVTDEAT